MTSQHDCTDTFAGGGDTPATAHRFTAEDVLAVSRQTCPRPRTSRSTRPTAVRDVFNLRRAAAGRSARR